MFRVSAYGAARAVRGLFEAAAASRGEACVAERRSGAQRQRGMQRARMAQRQQREMEKRSGAKRRVMRVRVRVHAANTRAATAQAR